MIILKLLFAYVVIGLLLWFLLVLAMSIVTMPIFPDSKDKRESIEMLEFISDAPAYIKAKAFAEFTISMILFWPYYVHDFVNKKNKEEK